VRPRLLTPFDQCGMAGFEGRLLDGLIMPPWRPGTVSVDHCVSSDKVQESVNCRNDVNKDVDSEDSFECDHIDVDTVDDPTPPSTAADAGGLSSSSLGIINIVRCFRVLSFVQMYSLL